MLIVEPHGGLCNRMRVVDSAIRLGKLLDMPMRLVWRIDAELGAPFDGLFEPIPAFIDTVSFDTLRPGGGEALAAFTRGFRPDVVVDDPLTHALERTGVEGLRGKRSIHLKTWRNFFPAPAPAVHFTPVAALQERVAALTAGFSRTVGVHVRRTDLLEAADESPTEAFEARMRALIESGEADDFFLATDSLEVEERLRARFAGRIRSQPGRNLDRARPEAIADAVVDLYALARTRRVLGSHMSSFSVTAASIGGIAIEIVRRQRPRPAPKRDLPAPRFSVVVATRQRPEGLARLLAALRPQVEGRADREVVVVNDGSHDAAYQAVADRFGDIVRYEALATHRGIPGARNEAAERATGIEEFFNAVRPKPAPIPEPPAPAAAPAASQPRGFGRLLRLAPARPSPSRSEPPARPGA